MHIARTGFPGHSRRPSIFRKRGPDRLGEFTSPCRRFRQTPISLWMTSSALRNGSWIFTRCAGRSAFSRMAVGFRMFCYPVSHRRDLLSRCAAKPKKWSERQGTLQQTSTAISWVASIKSDFLANAEFSVTCVNPRDVSQFPKRFFADAFFLQVGRGPGVAALTF